MYLCMCKGVSVSEAAEAVRNGASSPDALIRKFGFEDDDCCGRCATDVVRLKDLVTIELVRSDASRAAMRYNRTRVSIKASV